MIKKNTLIFLIIMLVMVAAFILLKDQDSLDFLTKPDEPTATSLPPFVALETDSMSIIRFTAKGEEEVVISRVGENEWDISTVGGSITIGNIEEMTAEFNAIKTTVLLNIDMDNKAFGLDDPQYEFVFEFNDGHQKSIRIGNANPTQTGYYAQVDVNQIVIISQGGIENIVQLIRSAQTPPTPTVAPTSTSTD